MNYFGDIAKDEAIILAFNTNAADGSAATITGGTYRIYRGDATGTETATGLTVSVDHDGKTGSHLATVTTTDAFYVTGTDYSLHVDSGTVDGKTVTAFLAGFSIEHRTATLSNQAHGGAAATITAKSIAVTNSTGTAVNFTSSGSNGSGFLCIGDGTGNGITGAGGASGGAGLRVAATGGDGIGLDAAGNGSGADISGDITGTIDTTTTVTNGVSLANDAITSAKYDESTAFPVGRADSGSNLIARTGADGDTLESLSDQIDAGSSATSIAQRVWDGTVPLASRSTNMEQISGTGVTETTSGRLAGNFSVVFDNNDADTTKTADDIGGAGAPRIE